MLSTIMYELHHHIVQYSYQLSFYLIFMLPLPNSNYGVTTQTYNIIVGHKTLFTLVLENQQKKIVKNEMKWNLSINFIVQTRIFSEAIDQKFIISKVKERAFLFIMLMCLLKYETNS